MLKLKINRHYLSCVAVIISDFHIYLLVSTRECVDLDHIGGLVLSCRIVTPIIASIIRARATTTTADQQHHHRSQQLCQHQGSMLSISGKPGESDITSAIVEDLKSASENKVNLLDSGSSYLLQQTCRR